MRMKRRTFVKGMLGVGAVIPTKWAIPLAPTSVAQAAYVRPYGANAPWNIPVAGLRTHPHSKLYSERLFYEQPYSPGEWTLTFQGYTYPVYEAAAATDEYVVRARYADWGNLNTEKMPWNPSWRAPSGTDAQVIVLDPATGREWNLWQVKVNSQKGVIHCGSGSLVPGNYWTKTDGFPPPRGCGIQCLAMLVRPAEIENGVIPHALSMPIHSPHDSIYVPPATKLEGHPMALPTGIPEGMRFALAISDAEIDDWAASLPPQLGDAGKRSARVIATAMRDYGWFITDGGGAVHLQFEERLTAGRRWDALGLGNRNAEGQMYPRDLICSLIKPERVYALVDSNKYASACR